MGKAHISAVHLRAAALYLGSSLPVVTTLFDASMPRARSPGSLALEAGEFRDGSAELSSLSTASRERFALKSRGLGGGALASLAVL
jgi:hypothetical protein